MATKRAKGHDTFAVRPLRILRIQHGPTKRVDISAGYDGIYCRLGVQIDIAVDVDVHNVPTTA